MFLSCDSAALEMSADTGGTGDKDMLMDLPQLKRNMRRLLTDLGCVKKMALFRN